MADRKAAVLLKIEIENSPSVSIDEPKRKVLRAVGRRGAEEVDGANPTFL